MIGQFPHGIDIHVRNLKWALGQDNHIFIVTTSEIIEKFQLTSDECVTFLSSACQKSTDGFLNFWAEFPCLVENILKEINP
jgi:hypothetical protein